MNKKAAYAIVGKHVFLGSRAYSEQYDPFIILADDEAEAVRLGMEKLGTTNRRALCLEKLAPTEHRQIFKVEYVR